jgi:hypothetical protein
MKNPGEWKEIKQKRTVDLVVDDGQHTSVTLSLFNISKLRYPDHFFDREEFVERFHRWRMSDPVAQEGAVFPPTSIAPDRFLGIRVIAMASMLPALAGVVYLVCAGLGLGFEDYLGLRIGVAVIGLVLIGLGIFLRSVGIRSRRHLKSLFPEDPFFA